MALLYEEHCIPFAFEALKSWNYENFTLDVIPDPLRAGISMPSEATLIEVSMLDMEVPGDCYVNLLKEMKRPGTLIYAGDFIAHFISQEKPSLTTTSTKIKKPEQTG